MYTPFGDFRITSNKNNENNIDMTFTCKLDLSHFTGPKLGNNIEEYKKQCNFQERTTLLYFCKALGAYQAMEKMLTLQNNYGTILNHRVDSDIITKKELYNYINEIYSSFFDAIMALELITLEMNCDVNNIFLKIVHNSENEFIENMIKISEKEGVNIYGL